MKGWQSHDRLVKEQKYEAAASLVERMLEKARGAKDNTEWTRCLVRVTRLRIALAGHETAVRFLKEQPWPEDLAGSSILNLYYAHALTDYARTHSWEINKREKLETSGVADLEVWTREQIYQEVEKALEAVWQVRDRLEKPVDEWKEFLTPNTYPRGVRPTLRDAVSYLRVHNLADTNGWRPDELNEIFRLDLESLIAGDADGISLVDPARHPLEKIGAVLADLENRHAQKGEPEAALEARLERCRHLHRHFTEAEDQKRIQEDLEHRLEGYRGVPWWAEGMAQLAEFIRGGSEPDSMNRARERAIRGRSAFPDSPGGKHCLAIEHQIEAPEFTLAGMQNDNFLKKSLLVTHKNLEKVHFRAYAVDLLQAVETSDDYNLLPSGRELEKWMTGNAPVRQWETPLPATPDYRMHKTFVTPPLERAGTYLIVASARPDFGKNDNRIAGLYLTIGDLVMVTRHEGTGAEVTVLSGASGKGVANAEVMLYQFGYNQRHRRAETRLTDARGLVEFRTAQQNVQYFLVARKGDQVAFDPQQLYTYRQGRRPDTSSTLLFTDRSIYRPLQKMFWKAVLYRGDGTRFETSPGSTVTVTLRDINGEEVNSRTVTINGFGTASGEFTIPPGRALGEWRITSSAGGETPVRVEEYKRPTFEAKMLDPEEPLRLNQTALLKGEAKYYFGLPVTGGQVRWLVRREPVFPWWWRYGGWGAFASPRSQVVASGSTALDQDGTFSIGFTPGIDERLGKNRDVSYRYSVEADVTDEGGETRSTARSFRLGFVSVEASAIMDKAFFLETDPVGITLRRASLDGTPKAGQGSWRIVSLTGPERALLPAEQPLFVPGEVQANRGYQTPGDLERERWNPGYDTEAVLLGWAEGAVRASGTVIHSENGEGKISAGRLAPGAYRLVYATADDFGAKCELRENFIVAAPSMKLPLPALFQVETPSIRVGETARVLVHSGLDDQTAVFEIYRDRKRIRRQEVRSGIDSSLVEIPITEADRGGLAVVMTIVRDHQFLRFEQSLLVPWDNKELKVEFSTFRDRLRPGRQEKWSVRVSGPAGAEVAVPAAELLAYMYDRSLDAFGPHSTPDPLSLYPYRARALHPRANLGQANQQWIDSRGFSRGPLPPTFAGDVLELYDGYGIGGPGRRMMSGSFAGIAAEQINVQRDRITANEIRYNSGIVTPMALNPEAIGEFKMVLEPVDAEMARGDRQENGTPAAVELRSNFSETAFWEPHLLNGPDGSVTFEFKVPDSVTSWNVWVHAITRDLQSGSVTREARSVKELMVRPYLPRFLREGDLAEIKVVVNNASDRELTGTLAFDIIDPDTDRSLLERFGLGEAGAGEKPFTAPAGGGTNLTFPIRTPAKVGPIAFKVTATSGDFSDGELRPLSVLPGRVHLAQSRFAALREPGERILRFEDLARDDDPTRIDERMVVTLDSQLFYSVLSALPYLVNYPYECTEQTLNRFVSTGILTSLYGRYPAVEKMAREFSSRQTQLEQWDAEDPNRKMALEETPWLQEAKGGEAGPSDLINVLDSRIAREERRSALAKLGQAQTSSGGFPWFSGGAPSPYMTLYTLYGLSKAREFGVEVPRDMVLAAWNYLHRHYLDDVVREMTRDDAGWELVTFVNYVLSNYPDPSWYENTFTPADRKTMLEFGFRHWTRHSPYLKGHLALTLKRMGRPEDARLVWESVIDSARTTEDQGTFWAPEERAWLWYNDTIETHAFALRTAMELTPADPKLDGMALWLFLNKKLNHWKSTRATAEVIYSLAHYLKNTGQLGIREGATVTVGGRKTTFLFEPDRYTGKKNQVVVPGEEIDPAATSRVTVEKSGKGYLLASATWHFSTERLPEEERGDALRLTRTYFKRVNTGTSFELRPLGDGAALSPGDEVEVHLSLTSRHPMEYVHLRDPRGAGFEPSGNLSRHKWDLGIAWYEEIRDSGTNFFFERVPQGEYAFSYRIRAATAGTFKVAPATVQPMYAPEFAAYSTGATLRVSP
ncbi:MAG: hypothetical protein GXY47_11695 [Acidobacteria bacterium]|nr:hypothetical protein [Acidobacteriota bacterium]